VVLRDGRVYRNYQMPVANNKEENTMTCRCDFLYVRKTDKGIGSADG
jgi:hypothetical protein